MVWPVQRLPGASPPYSSSATRSSTVSTGWSRIVDALTPRGSINRHIFYYIIGIKYVHLNLTAYRSVEISRTFSMTRANLAGDAVPVTNQRLSAPQHISKSRLPNQKGKESEHHENTSLARKTKDATSLHTNDDTS